MNRRRVIQICGAALAGALIPSSNRRGLQAVRWSGRALGADAEITLYHPEPAAAQKLITACIVEIRRLEGIFSLYRRDSALVALNKRGFLTDPPRELLSLSRTALDISRETGGIFDVTMQPLWSAYATHFAQAAPDPRGPPETVLAAARARVSWRHLRVGDDRIAFAKPDMAASFNGIAQGYITDRVAELMKGAGIEDTLINLGEFRALGAHPDGRPWRIGIGVESVPLHDSAAATSSSAGTRFEPNGRFHHLIDPRSGRPAERRGRVTVVHPSATLADALSTALLILPRDRVSDLLRRFDDPTVIFGEESSADSRFLPASTPQTGGKSGSG